MKFNQFKKIVLVLMGCAIIVTLASCEKKSEITAPSIEMNVAADTYFNIVLSTSTEGNTGTLVQSFTDATKGEVSFEGFGYEVFSTRTARLFASTDGKTAYNLDYGGGTVTKYDVLGAQDYVRNEQLNVALAMGTEYPRGTKFSDANMLLHTVNSKAVYKDAEETVYDYFKANARIANVNLEDLSMGETTDFEIVVSDEYKKKGLYVFRIDAPAIVGGKAYYGLAMSWKDANGDRPEGSSTPAYQSHSLVVDYPSLKNPKLIASSVSQGSTYGYRIPVAHVDEKGDIYQITKTHLLKITDGAYDNSFDFNLEAAAGVNAQGWFYVGKGIGYATTYDPKIGSSSKLKAWGITRVDIYNKTAIKMNVVTELSLGQYQMAKVKDGKLYMALAPVGKDGNVYIFNAEEADANGFDLGATIRNTGVDNSYIGIY